MKLRLSHRLRIPTETNVLHYLHRSQSHSLSQCVDGSLVAPNMSIVLPMNAVDHIVIVAVVNWPEYMNVQRLAILNAIVLNCLHTMQCPVVKFAQKLFL